MARKNAKSELLNLKGFRVTRFERLRFQIYFAYLEMILGNLARN